MKTYRLINEEVRRRAQEAVWDAPDGHFCIIKDQTRTLEQNAAQWPILTCFSKQLLWPVNGDRVRMENEEWKDVLTAGFEGDTVRLAAGLNGGVVMLGRRTSEYGKGKFSEWIEFLHATAALRGINVQGK